MENIDELKKRLERIIHEAETIGASKIRIGWFGNTVTSHKRTPPTPMDRLSERARLLNNGREAGFNARGFYPAIPPRPFMDVYRTKHSATTSKDVAKAVKRIIDGWDAMKIMARVGDVGVAGLVKSMNDKSEYAPNAPSTISAWAARHSAQIKRNRKAKGISMDAPFDKQPLRDTGELIQSVHWDIAPNKK